MQNFIEEVNRDNQQMSDISIVAGGAGFIAASLIKNLNKENRKILIVDNLTRGKLSYIEEYLYSEKIYFYNADLSERDKCIAVFEYAIKIGHIDEVWHLAANSDIPAGVADADVDLKDTFFTTVELLRAMKMYNVHKLYFASSSAVYGDHGDIELHENIGPLLPISNYGAMKLASEALISAAVESYLHSACIYRFPNVVGVPATHGVILDFINKLKSNPDILEVLGDGTQQKSYLHVSDLVDAMLTVRHILKDSHTVEIVNIGPTDNGVTVKWIAEQVVARVSPKASIMYGTGNKGWIGDVPKFNYSTARLQSYGWRPTLGSDAAVMRAIDEISIQQGF